MNVHDDQCTAGNELPDWLTEIPEVSMINSYDEKNLIHQNL